MEFNTNVGVFAGMNQKNSTKAMDAANLAMEGSLVSRFDLVYEIKPIDDKQHENMIIEHILKGTTMWEGTWSLARIKMHILVAKHIQVKLSDDVQQVLQQYYIAGIDESRVTLRMYGSLERIATCHAKLMMREETTLLDAAAAIMINDNGKLLEFRKTPATFP